MTARRALTLLVFVMVHGCEPPTTAQGGAVVSDSLGVRVVHNGSTAALPTVSVDGPPDLLVGWDPAGPLFQRIGSGVLLPDGGVAVVDAQSAEVHLIHPDGSSAVIGQRGEGPGEFTRPGTIHALGGDRLVVWDAAVGRLTTFAANGNLIGSDLVPAGRSTAPFGRIGETTLGWLPSGVPMRAGVGEYTGYLITRDLVTGVADTAREVTTAVFDLEDGQINSNPFTVFGGGDVVPGRFIWAINNRPEVRWIAPDGSVSQIATWSPEPQHIDERLWAEYERLYRARSTAQAGQARDRALAERLREQRADAPEVLPYFRWIHGTDSGGVWVSEYTMTAGLPSQFLVIDPDGVAERYLRFETPIRILDISEGRVLGVHRDSLGVEAVGVYSTASWLRSN